MQLFLLFLPLFLSDYFPQSRTIVSCSWIFRLSRSLMLFSLSNADLSSFNGVSPGMPENAPAVWNASLPSYLQAHDPNSCCPQQLSPQQTHPDPTKPCANSFALLQLNLPISNFYKVLHGWVSFQIHRELSDGRCA